MLGDLVPVEAAWAERDGVTARLLAADDATSHSARDRAVPARPARRPGAPRDPGSGIVAGVGAGDPLGLLMSATQRARRRRSLAANLQGVLVGEDAVLRARRRPARAASRGAVPSARSAYAHLDNSAKANLELLFELQRPERVRGRAVDGRLRRLREGGGGGDVGAGLLTLELLHRRPGSRSRVRRGRAARAARARRAAALGRASRPLLWRSVPRPVAGPRRAVGLATRGGRDALPASRRRPAASLHRSRAAAPIRTDAAALIVVDTSRSMLAATSASGADPRSQRARRAALRIRARLPGIPVGIASRERPRPPAPLPVAGPRGLRRHARPHDPAGPPGARRATVEAGRT